MVSLARQLGFTLEEIRELFFGFRDGVRASRRWRKLSQKKLAELDDLMRGIREAQRVLHKMIEKCHCSTLDQCGKGIFERGFGKPILETQFSRRRRVR